MAFDTLRLVSATSLRWIYDGQYTPTDFLVYLLAVDGKGRIVRADERRGLQDERRRREDRAEGTLRRFRPPDSSHVHFPLSSRFPAVAGTIAALHRAALFPLLSIAKREMGIPLI